MMTAQRWLNLWGDTVKLGLQGCKGAPTIIFDSRLVILNVDNALKKLKALLERAGVRGLKMPEPEEVQLQIKDHVRNTPRQYRLKKVVQTRLGLDEQPTVDNVPPQMTGEQVSSARKLDTELSCKFASMAGSDAEFACTLCSKAVCTIVVHIEDTSLVKCAK
jgi:hypothetical protein